MKEQTLSYKQYLEGLPPERRSVVEEVWRVVRENIPAGYTEVINSGFLTFKAGEEWYVALANRKNYVTLHLLPIYVFPELKAKLDNSGKKLKCGKGCINFTRAEELPLDVLREIVGAFEGEAYREHMRRIRSARGKKEKRAGAAK
jgi:uncharacterized protein YdhG (YjbR/CyaY superfamily)